MNYKQIAFIKKQQKQNYQALDKISSSWVHVQKAQLQGWHLNAKDVVDKLNLDNILKLELWYRKL